MQLITCRLAFSTNTPTQYRIGTMLAGSGTARGSTPCEKTCTTLSLIFLLLAGSPSRNHPPMVPEPGPHGVTLPPGALTLPASPSHLAHVMPQWAMAVGGLDLSFGDTMLMASPLPTTNRPAAEPTTNHPEAASGSSVAVDGAAASQQLPNYHHYQASPTQLVEILVEPDEEVQQPAQQPPADLMVDVAGSGFSVTTDLPPGVVLGVPVSDAPATGTMEVAGAHVAPPHTQSVVTATTAGPVAPEEAVTVLTAAGGMAHGAPAAAQQVLSQQPVLPTAPTTSSATQTPGGNVHGTRHSHSDPGRAPHSGEASAASSNHAPTAHVDGGQPQQAGSTAEAGSSSSAQLPPSQHVTTERVLYAPLSSSPAVRTRTSSTGNTKHNSTNSSNGGGDLGSNDGSSGSSGRNSRNRSAGGRSSSGGSSGGSSCSMASSSHTTSAAGTDSAPPASDTSHPAAAGPVPVTEAHAHHPINHPSASSSQIHAQSLPSEANSSATMATPVVPPLTLPAPALAPVVPRLTLATSGSTISTSSSERAAEHGFLSARNQATHTNHQPPANHRPSTPTAAARPSIWNQPRAGGRYGAPNNAAVPTNISLPTNSTAQNSSTSILTNLTGTPHISASTSGPTQGNSSLLGSAAGTNYFNQPVTNPTAPTASRSLLVKPLSLSEVLRRPGM